MPKHSFDVIDPNFAPVEHGLLSAAAMKALATGRTEPSAVWSVDFTRKRLDDTQSFSCCNVLDIDRGLWLAGVVRSHFNTGSLIDILEGAGDEYGFPRAVEIDHLADGGMNEMVRWGARHGITVLVPAIGKPLRAVRVPVPTSQRWRSIASAQKTVDAWRRLFNARVPVFLH